MQIYKYNLLKTVRKALCVKKNNKGYTLVELIVVIAIVALLASIITYSIGIVSRNRSREAASDFSALLSAAKISTMSGEVEIDDSDPDNIKINSPMIELAYSTGDDVFYGNVYTVSRTTPSNVEDLGDGSLSVSYTIGSNASQEINDTSAITRISISYNNETGAVAEFAENGTPANLTGVSQIIVDFGSSQITIYPATGYHELN